VLVLVLALVGGLVGGLFGREKGVQRGRGWGWVVEGVGSFWWGGEKGQGSDVVMEFLSHVLALRRHPRSPIKQPNRFRADSTCGHAS
jgi:hypothetical protein